MTNPFDPAAVRATLEDRRAELRAELALGIEAPGQMTYGSQAAAASQVFAEQRDLALRDKALRDLAMVEGALARLTTAPTAVHRLRRARRRRPPGGPPVGERCIDCQRRARL